jgi:hypothetical protein
MASLEQRAKPERDLRASAQRQHGANEAKKAPA